MSLDFRGKNRRCRYFEGWYFKQHKDGRVLALIPGVAMERNGKKSAFLQVINDESSHLLSFPFAAFSRTGDEIRVGPNRFSPRGIELDIREPELRLRGALRYGYLTPLRYPIMGPFAFLPRMECYHDILSMNHVLSGELEYNGKPWDFQGGKGYLEKDRGRSFPRFYHWMQANDFGLRNVSVMAAVAHIPTFQFTGCIAALLYHKKIYTFTTYQRVRVEKNGGGVLTLTQNRRRLELETGPGLALPLRAPKEGALARTIHEHASTRMALRFYENEALVFAGESAAAGYESVSE